MCGIICMQYSIVVRTRQESTRATDVSRYRDSMRPLIARDIMQAATMPNRLEARQNVPSRCSP